MFYSTLVLVLGYSMLPGARRWHVPCVALAQQVDLEAWSVAATDNI